MKIKKVQKAKQQPKMILVNRESLEKNTHQNARRYYDLETNTTIIYF